MDAAVQPGAVIVHFGMHKTGSTSIQKSLHARLADARFHYVDLGEADAGVALATAFGGHPQEARARTRARLEAELRAAGSRTAILSAEKISSFDAAEFGALRAALAAHGGEVRAVGYVRRPKEAMESVFQQRFRGRGRKLLARGLFDNLYPDYRRKLEKFDSELGRANVQLWPFLPQAFPAGCVVQDFCARLGIQFAAHDVVRANEGLSRHALSLVLAYRRFGPAEDAAPRARRENGLLMRRVASLPGPKLRLHSSVVAPILDAHRADLAWIEARLGASLAEDLGANDGHAIRSEEELLSFAPESLQWLAEQLGEPYLQRWHARLSPEEVAQWMHALRARLAEPAREGVA